MKISELILAIGDDNVQFQNLDHSADTLKLVGGTTKITFGTEEPFSFKGTERLGLVLWLDRQAVANAIATAPTRPTGGDAGATLPQEEPAEEIGRLVNRIVELAPSAGLFAEIKIRPAATEGSAAA